MAVLTSRGAGVKARTFPQQLAYTGFATYRAVGSERLLERPDRPQLSAQAVQTLASVPQVSLRGTYHTTGYQAGADLLLWLAAPDPDALQDALTAFGQTPLASAFERVWSAFGVHRETDSDHWSASAYFRGEPALRYLCVCPVSHEAGSHEPGSADRRRLEADRDRLFKRHRDVQVSVVAAAGLGPYERILALEAGELARLVDAVRDLGALARGRSLVGSTPAISGARKPLAEIVDALP